MKIYRAATYGFCYGVRRAMKIAEDAAEKGIPAVTLGPLIHNPQVVERLRRKGIPPADSLDGIKKEIVIIRSHGVGPSCYNKIKCENLTLLDATCPFVMRNQQIVRKLAEENQQIVLIGEKTHPEMRSVAEWAGNRAYIVENLEDVKQLPHFEDVHIVLQTTFSESLANELIAAVSVGADHTEIHKTICSATSERQQAARELARKVGVMIVVGGRNSANTTRLAEICRSEGARTYHIETAAEIRRDWFQDQDKIGITAGASTPDWIIEEVVCIMEEINKEISKDNDMGKMLAQMDDGDYDFHKGSIVEGKVVVLEDDKAYVSFGYKTEAILPIREYSYPAPESLKDVLKVGDSVRAQIVNAVKEDNPIYVSKIKVDRLADWDFVEAAMEKNEPVECEGIEAIKVGLLVQIKSLRGFIPLSQGDLRFVHSLAGLVKKTFKARILEIDRAKNRLVLSRKAILEEERVEEMNVLEKAFADGEILTGTVKKIMPYGAFIDIGGVEGLLHISDISWKKIGKVEDVLQPEQQIEVKIKSFEKEKNRISFSHKECLPNPWTTSIHNHQLDETVEAKVVKILEFGVIVELEDGLTGLLHINEMTHDHNLKPSDICALGDKIEVRISGIDENRKRISFALVKAAERKEEALEEAPAAPTEE